jgi:hypothetical protein
MNDELIVNRNQIPPTVYTIINTLQLGGFPQLLSGRLCAGFTPRKSAQRL